jgi:hypothetical protein
MSPVQPDEKFLQDYLKDARSEMTWRRELEFRMLQFLLVFYPIIATVMVALFQNTATTPQVYGIVAVGASILIIAASLFVTDRVRREHQAYAGLARTVQKIWTHYGLFESGAYLDNDTVLPVALLDSRTGFGQGQGHKRTLALIWLVTSAMILMMLTLAVTKR